MSAETAWAWDQGNYDEVGRRLVELAGHLVAGVGDRIGGLQSRRVVDLACGTGNAALAAASRGAEVTGVDLGASLLGLARERADAGGLDVTWRLADATDTGLPAAAHDAVMSSVGLIFVPDREAAVSEVARLLRPGGCFGYTAWAQDPRSPFFTPFESFLPESHDDAGPRPWEWAEPAIVSADLAGDFEDVVVEPRVFSWSFATVEEALHLVEASPMHVVGLEQVAQADRPLLRAAFVDAFESLRGADGTLTYASSYVVVTARRRG